MVLANIRTVEINNGANHYSIYATGTGTGTLSTLTDSSATWKLDEWNGWKLTDSTGTTFTISDTTKTALTVTGTPATGTYTITPTDAGVSGFKQLGDDYAYSGASGTGTLNTWTDTTASWITDRWKNNYKLLANSIGYTITANTATTLTISGTPTTGSYQILPLTPAENVTVILEAEKVDIDWSNSVMSISRPISNSSQTTGYNVGEGYTYDPQTQILTNTTGNFNSALTIYDRLTIGTTEYIMMSKPSGATVLIQNYPTVATSGTIAKCCKAQKNYGINLKKIEMNLTVDGYLTNDYIHHTDYATKYYAEEKLDRLFKIAADNIDNNRYANVIIRERALMGEKFTNIPTSVGTMACTKIKIIDDSKTCAPVRGGGTSTQRVDKLRVTLSFKKQDPKL